MKTLTYTLSNTKYVDYVSVTELKFKSGFYYELKLFNKAMEFKTQITVVTNLDRKVRLIRRSGLTTSIRGLVPSFASLLQRNPLHEFKGLENVTNVYIKEGKFVPEKLDTLVVNCLLLIRVTP
jgi:hypothetical protein